MNKKAKASGGGSDPAVIEPINGGGSGTGGGSIGHNQPGNIVTPDVVPDPVIVADPISSGGSEYTAPVWCPPDNTVIDDIDITTPTGGITITDTDIVIIGGAEGQVQTFKAGTVSYDSLATYYRAKDSGMVAVNQSYTEHAVANFYLAVERFGTDNAVKNMSTTAAAYWQAVNAYCPFTYLPIAEQKYRATVTTGGTTQDLSAYYTAAYIAKKALNEYVKNDTFGKYLAEYEAGRLSEEEYQTRVAEYQALQKAYSDALSLYNQLGGTLVIW